MKKSDNESAAMADVVAVNQFGHKQVSIVGSWQQVGK
jgi:hypothetical protein